MYNIYVEEKRNKKIELEEKEKKNFSVIGKNSKVRFKINLLPQK